MKLDFTSLEKAVASLEKAVIRSKGVPHDEEIRDAVIQRFEYTFELCWKMMKRQLELEVPHPAELDTMPYKDLIRLAAEKGMMGEVKNWMVYRSQRNMTSHVYDSSKAEQVYQSAVQFLSDAKKLLDHLVHRS
jgi:nucleotidyltransferase substrate binding protein (TIGR01987 family)